MKTNLVENCKLCGNRTQLHNICEAKWNLIITFKIYKILFGTECFMKLIKLSPANLAGEAFSNETLIRCWLLLKYDISKWVGITWPPRSNRGVTSLIYVFVSNCCFLLKKRVKIMSYSLACFKSIYFTDFSFLSQFFFGIFYFVF